MLDVLEVEDQDLELRQADLEALARVLPGVPQVQPVQGQHSHLTTQLLLLHLLLVLRLVFARYARCGFSLSSLADLTRIRGMTASFMYPAYICSCPFAFPILISMFRACSWFPILASNTLWYDWFVIGITALTYFPGVFPVISRPVMFTPLAC